MPTNPNKTSRPIHLKFKAMFEKLKSKLNSMKHVTTSVDAW